MTKKTLHRNLSLGAATAIAISMVIGSGLFALPGLAIDVSDPITALLSWFLVAVCVAPLIQIFAKLGQILPNANGIAGFASFGLGEWSLGGFNLIACGALAFGMPAFFFVAGSYVCDLFSLNHQVWRAPIAILIVWVATFMNIRGLQNISFINKSIVIAVLLVMGGIIMLSLHRLGFETILSFSIPDTYTLNLNTLWASSVIIFWAFQGWENLTFGLEEVKNPSRNIPKIFWCSFFIVTAIYLIFAWVISLSVISGYSVSGVSGLTALLGTGYINRGVLLLITVILIANANAWVFGASRAYYAAAKNGVFPSVIALTNRRGIPNWSLGVAGVFYTGVIGIIEYMHLSIATAFMITTQGFIILYGFSIYSYICLCYKSIWAWISTIIAFIGWVFLMHNFNLLLLYPLGLFIFGIFKFKRLERLN